MFKIKGTKKSTVTTASINENSNIGDKKIVLIQNNDFINVQEKLISEEKNNNNLQLASSNPPTLLRNGSFRPRSGVNQNLAQTSTLKYDASDEEKIQQKIRQKKMNKTKLQRPSTSTNLNESSGIRNEKKQRLMNRKVTLNTNMNNTSNNYCFKNNPNYQSSQHIEDYSTNESNENGYVSNEYAMNLMLSILNGEEKYLQLKSANESQFERIKEKLVSNISIIVLKWSKIIQDKLYNEVKNISSNKEQYNKEIPTSIQELIRGQIKRHFLKDNGLFTVEQRCNNQQSKLQRLIDTRLQKLEDMLTVNGN